jgi:hypothetical protein
MQPWQMLSGKGGGPGGGVDGSGIGRGVGAETTKAGPSGPAWMSREPRAGYIR